MKGNKEVRGKRKAQQEPESESEEEENVIRSDRDDEQHTGEESFDDVPDDEFEDIDDMDEESNGKGDGLANTMAQLLQQQTGSKVNATKLLIG
jgi:hypothetical protein